MWPWAAALAVVAIAATHLWAGCPLSGIGGIGKGSGKAASRTAAADGPSAEGVFRCVGGCMTKSTCGKYDWALLDLAPATGGPSVRVLADKGLRDKIQPGELYTVTLVKNPVSAYVRGATTGYMVRNFRPYKLAAGEDQPGVFVLQRVVEETAGAQPRVGMELSKLGQSCTVWVPNRRAADGTYAPDADLEKEVRGLKKGGPVRVSATPSGRTLVLKSVSPYTPPLEGEFVETVTEKVGEHEYTGATFKAEGRTVTALVPGKPGKNGEVMADPKLSAVVRHLKAGQRVTFEVREADGQMWLEDIRPGGKRT
jgi:hypothetical protein